MDGKDAWRDNVFAERLEVAKVRGDLSTCVRLHIEVKRFMGSYVRFYDEHGPDSYHGSQTPGAADFNQSLPEAT